MLSADRPSSSTPHRLSAWAHELGHHLSTSASVAVPGHELSLHDAERYMNNEAVLAQSAGLSACKAMADELLAKGEAERAHRAALISRTKELADRARELEAGVRETSVEIVSLESRVSIAKAEVQEKRQRKLLYEAYERQLVEHVAYYNEYMVMIDKSCPDYNDAIERYVRVPLSEASRFSFEYKMLILSSSRYRSANVPALQESSLNSVIQTVPPNLVLKSMTTQIRSQLKEVQELVAGHGASAATTTGPESKPGRSTSADSRILIRALLQKAVEQHIDAFTEKEALLNQAHSVDSRVQTVMRNLTSVVEKASTDPQMREAVRRELLSRADLAAARATHARIVKYATELDAHHRALKSEWSNLGAKCDDIASFSAQLVSGGGVGRTWDSAWMGPHPRIR
ncbi:hypothetical protein BDK51DRAFT_52003 [Blyttiomyces helicus]|uniref:Uncharacterized protein n=1 Tax=Blyttiomyces helicus TaxID=388810 RepID=A0A4P9W3G9_9FUNG|nr:hypothetical protein BDK51DRAFT_52003 [Blyttiomyces helicus]|eukprot:RKO84676.1 hypothetical protein BDK51DRAFT_52003 [Blyttiomyces helicus]